MNLVCIPFHDYKIAYKEGFRTRDSHLYAHFFENDIFEKVIVINRPTNILEILLRRKKLVHNKKDVIYSKGGLYISEVHKNIFVIDVLDFGAISVLLQGKKIISELYLRNSKRILKALEILDVKESVTYESSPLTYHLSKKIKSKYRIFDGVDNLCKHPTYKNFRENVMELYKKIILTYNKVYFNSRDSINYFDVSNNINVEFLDNGVDFERFRKDIFKYRFPKNGRKKVVYAGKMQDLVDVELLREMARNFVDVDFYMLGKVLNSNIKTSLRNEINIYFLGDIKYDYLPDYILSADVCFIPYNVNNQHGGDPIKFYEYMAANKPIVSTEIGEIAKYHNGRDIFVVSKEDFIVSLEKCLIFSGSINNILPESFTWKYKSEYMVSNILREN